MEAIALGILTGIFILTMIVVGKGPSHALDFLAKKSFLFGFLLAFVSMIASLVYSNYIGYPPCELCWLARTLFYPQIILFAIAIAKRDRSVIDYALGLSLLGLVLTIYHYLVELGVTPEPFCSATGVSCAARFVYEYGFVTIPFMGIVLFAALSVLMLNAKYRLK